MPNPDALSSAREILPWWVTWGALVGWSITTLVVAIVGCLSTLTDLRAARDRSQHWTERARHFHRASLATSTVHLFLCIAILSGALTVEPLFSPVSAGVIGLIAITCAFVVHAAWGCFAAVHVSRMTVGKWFGSFARAQLLGGIAVFVLIAIGLTMPLHPTLPVFVVAVLLTTGSVLILLGFGPFVLARMGLADARSARDLALPEGLIPDDVRVFDTDLGMANAFVSPWSSTIVLTTRLREVLDPRGLEAVLRHELGHLKEGVASRVVRLAVLWLLVVVAWLRPCVGGVGPGIACAIVVVSILAVFFAQARSRKLEMRADHHAHAGGLEADYARALERLHIENLMPAVLFPSRFRSHPDLVERMRAAGVEPEWPIPAPPAKRLPVSTQVCVAVLFVFGLVVLPASAVQSSQWAGASPQKHMGALALGTTTPRSVTELAYASLDDDEYERALVLYRAAAVLAPSDLVNEFGISYAQARCGLCTEARATLARADRRLGNSSVEELLDWREAARSAIEHCGR